MYSSDSAMPLSFDALPTAVDHRGEPVARLRLLGLSEGFDQQHLVVAFGRRPLRRNTAIEPD